MSARRLRLRLPDRDLGGAAVRRLLTALGVAVLSLGLWWPAAPAQAEEPAATTASRFGACLAQGKQGDLVLLVDESASLRTNDPSNGRVTASEHLVRGLAELAKEGVTVNVRVDTFSTSYANGSGWTALSEQSLPGVLNQVTALANRRQGTGTDYWLALDGARQHLAERAAAGSTCQAILFFSDGEMDIDRGPGENDYTVAPRPYDPTNKLRNPADRERASKSATESLCRPGGLADQLRSAQVMMFGIGLQGPNPGKFDLMRSIVTGSSPAGPCGSIVDPPPGDFYAAGSVGDLLLAFNQVKAPGRITERDVCQGDVCPEGAHSFVLDPSVGRVEILGTSSGSGEPPQVVLVDPSGAQTVIPTAAGEQKLPLPQTVASGRWLEPRTAAITLTREGSQSWTGQWQVVFVDRAKTSAGSKSKTSLRIVGDVRPAWVNADSTGTWRQGGEPVALQLGLVDGAGQPVTPSAVLGKMQMAVDVVSSRGTHRLGVLDQSSLANPVMVDPGTVGLGTATLSLTLDITTKAVTDPQGRSVSGTPLATQQVDTPVTVQPPVGYPSLGAGPVQFGSAEGPAHLSAALPITGPGCVWLSGDRAVAGPDGVPWEVTSPANRAESCVKVPEGGSGELPLTLTSKEAGNGGLTGEITVSSAPLDGSSAPRETAVGYRASLAKPLNQTSFVLVFVAALLLGPGIPLGLLYLFRYLVAARIPGESLMVTQVPVTLGEAGQLLRDGAALAPQPHDLSQILPGTGRPLRRVDLGSGIVLRTRTGWSPFAAPYVQVESPGAVGVSDSHGAPMPKSGWARLPVAVQNHWVLVQRHSDPADQATLVLIAGASASAEQRKDLYQTAADRAQQSFKALAAARPAGSSAPETSSPFGPVSTSGQAAENPFGPVGPAATTGPATASPFGVPGTPPAGEAGGGPFGVPGTPPAGEASGGPFGSAAAGGPSGVPGGASGADETRGQAGSTPPADPFGVAGAPPGADGPFGAPAASPGPASSGPGGGPFGPAAPPSTFETASAGSAGAPAAGDPFGPASATVIAGPYQPAAPPPQAAPLTYQPEAPPQGVPPAPDGSNPNA